MSPSTSPRSFTDREVACHCTKESCWVLMGTRVYDVTAFLRMHPGGEALILRRSGTDVSRYLEGPPHRHSENARRWMEQYYIGELERQSGADGAQVRVRNLRPAGGGVKPSTFALNPECSNITPPRAGTFKAFWLLCLTICIGSHRGNQIPVNHLEFSIPASFALVLGWLGKGGGGGGGSGRSASVFAEPVS